MIKLDEEENALSPPATAPEVEPCPKEHRPLVYRAEAPCFSFLGSSVAKKRKNFSSVMTNGPRGRKVMRGGKNKAGIGAGQGSLVKAADVIDAALTDSDAPRSEAESAVQVLNAAKREYLFARDETFSELDDLYELKACSALSRKVSMVSAGTPWNTSGALGQTNSARSVFSKNEIRKAVSFMSRVMDPKEHDYTFCSDILFFDWRKSLCAEMEMAEDAKAELERGKERISHVFEFDG